MEPSIAGLSRPNLRDRLLKLAESGNRLIKKHQKLAVKLQAHADEIAAALVEFDVPSDLKPSPPLVAPASPPLVGWGGIKPPAACPPCPPGPNMYWDRTHQRWDNFYDSRYKDEESGSDQPAVQTIVISDDEPSAR